MPRTPANVAPPRAIPESETVAGLRVDAGLEPRVARARSRSQASAVVGSELSRACLTDLTPPSVPRRTSFEFPFAFPSALPVRETGRIVISAGVHAIRIQRLLEKEGRSYLEVADAWVDAKTLGARLRERAEIPLARLARDPLGSDVFAFRDASRIWLIVDAPEGGVVFGPNANARSTCGHVLASLEVSPKGAALAVLVGARGDADAEGVRPFSAVQVSASVSRSSRDRDPVLSVTLARPPRELEKAAAAAVPNLPSPPRTPTIRTPARPRS
jgi:hypothetical protein